MEDFGFSFEGPDATYDDADYWAEWDRAANDYMSENYGDVMGPPASAAGGNQDGGVGYNYYYGDNEVVGPHPTNVQGSLIDTSYLKPGDEGYGWQYFTDGTVVSPNNTYYMDGKAIWGPDSGFMGEVGSFLKGLGSSAAGMLKNTLIDPNTNKPNMRNIAALAGGLYGLSQGSPTPEKTGYQGGIPQYEAVREAVPGAYDPERRPGSSGQRYFTDTRYSAPGEAAATRTSAQQEAQGLATMNRENPTREAAERGAESAAVNEAAGYAAGGLAMLAKGGAPRYLDGASDGMADKIPARIDDGQEARLSHGEFVIPADVVGHLGNGNSEAGATRLYDMMDKIRKARTGTTKQGKQINPNKFLPS